MKTSKNNISFKLKNEHIELNKLLKYTGIAESGAHAKQLILDGAVSLNSKSETRIRAKLRKGDVVRALQMIINIE